MSAGRNSGIRLARGRNLIFVSDDVLTPPDFVRRHVEMLERMPGYWVVGAFRQRDSLTDTPFGRYLDELEREFERARTSHQIAPGLWEMTWPTARNLSLPRADIERIGLFDERFRTTCEDQDLAERARRIGIRFVYAAEIDCVHNDQTADLARYCNFQERGARDTVALCDKSPELHGGAEIIRVNGPISRTDGVRACAEEARQIRARSDGSPAERSTARSPALSACGSRSLSCDVPTSWRSPWRSFAVGGPDWPRGAATTWLNVNCPKSTMLSDRARLSVVIATYNHAEVELRRRAGGRPESVLW